MYSVSATGLTGSPVAAHIHMETAGNAGDVIFDFGAATAGTDGVTYIWTGMTPPLSDDETGMLQNGGLYVNIHTADNATGEIRGQITAAGGKPGCADSSRVFFTAGAPVSGQGSVVGCRRLTQDLCDKGWQYPGGDSSRGAVSCFYRDDLSACVGCGPNNSSMCANTCAAQ